MSWLTNGLQKRPPLQHVAQLTDTQHGVTLSDYTSATVHYINRGTAGEFVMASFEGAAGLLKVWNPDGTEKVMTIQAADSFNYLDHVADQHKENPLRFMTIADATVIVNPEVTATMQASTTRGVIVDEFFIFVKVVANTAANDFEVQLKHPSVAAGALQVNQFVDNGDAGVLAGLISTWIAGLGGGAFFTVEDINDGGVISAPVIRVRWGGGVPMDKVAVSHKKGEGYIDAIYGEAKDITDLPAYCINGTRLKINPDADSEFDDYWVKFVTDEGHSEGKGTWFEDVDPTVEYLLDQTNCWHIAAYDPDTDEFTFLDSRAHGGSFPTLEAGDYDIGDLNTNPYPKFIGKQIRDVALYRNRLAFLTDDTIDFSESGEFFNFFRTTVRQALSTDPLQIELGFSQAVGFRHMLPYQGSLIVFGLDSQFRVFSDGPFTNTTAEADHISSYPCSDVGRPAATELDILFPFGSGSYSGVYRYEPSQQADARFAVENTTLRVPNYLQGKVKQMATLPRDRVAVALCVDDPSSLYVMNYYVGDRDQRRAENLSAQAAWHKLTFNDSEIHGIGFIDNILYIVNKRAEGWFLEKMEFSPDIVDVDQTYLSHLDRRITQDDCSVVAYDIPADTTEFTLPYNISVGSEMKVVTRGASGGDILTVTSQVEGGNSLTVAGDYSSTDVWIGETYTMRYKFSLTPLLVEGVPILSGRNQYRRGIVDFEDTAYFKVTVTPAARTPHEIEYTGQPVTTNETILGVVPVSSGRFTFPIRTSDKGAEIEISSDSVFPCRIHSAEIEVDFETRYQRGFKA